MSEKECSHEWEVTDYCDDERDGVMRGPVCKKCGAICEHVFGARLAGLITLADLAIEIADTKRKHGLQ